MLKTFKRPEWKLPVCNALSPPSVESSFLLRQRFTPRQLSKDNRPIVLLLFLTFLHAKDIWHNIHVFQRGSPHLYGGAT